jgi:hypothetical protein
MDAADDAQLAAMGRSARSEVERHASCERVIDQLLAAYSPDTVIGLKRMEAC